MNRRRFQKKNNVVYTFNQKGLRERERALCQFRRRRRIFRNLLVITNIIKSYFSSACVSILEIKNIQTRKLSVLKN